MSDQPILTLKNISKDYKQGRSVVEVLKNIDLQVSRSQTIAIVGASGSSKSTLLHIAELLEVEQLQLTACLLPRFQIFVMPMKLGWNIWVLSINTIIC